MLERKNVLVTADQMDELLERAAKSGAKQALKELGLADDSAGQDIKDIRGILEGFRDARRTIFEAFLKWVTVAIMTVIVAGVTFHYGAK